MRLWAVLLSCAIGSATAADTPPTTTEQKSPVSIADFVRPADFSDVQLSPSGKYIAAIIAIPDNPHENAFAILDGQTGKVIRFIHSGARALIANYFWTSDERLVASLAIKPNGLDTPGLTGEIFAINVDGTQEIELFGYRKGKGDLLAKRMTDGGNYASGRVLDTTLIAPDEILIESSNFSRNRFGSQTNLQRLNVKNGRAFYVDDSPTLNSSLVVDHAGQARVSVASPDFIHFSMWVREKNGAAWKLANDPAKSGMEITPEGFTRDNKKLYVRVSQDKGPDAIELMDMDTLKRTPVYKGQFANPGPMLRTADRQDFYAIVTQDGKKGLYFLDEGSQEARLTKALQPSFPGQLATFTNFTQDGKRAVVYVRSDRNPGDFYIFNLDTMQAGHLVSARPQIDPQQMRPMEPVTVKSRDGLDLHGFLTLPSGSKPFPLIVLPHGGPHGISDEWGYNREAQLFAMHGYAVLQINYRGSGGYGDWFQRAGYRQWGLSMQDDLTDATHWAIDQGYTSAQKVCIYGASYGGYAALEGVVREPDLYKCAIGYAGVYDLRVQLNRSDTHNSKMGDAYLSLALGDNADDLLARSPLGGITKIKANLLLVHGGEDPRVPIHNFDELTNALDKNGKHYEELVMPHEGHGFFVPEHSQQAYEKMLDFLDRNIGHGQAAAGANGSH
jgi:dipeptidyl aminopeptidase/acylaminoacyl peptidase